MNILPSKFKVSSNIKIVIVPVTIITLIVITGLLFAPKGMSEINNKLKEYKSSQKQETVLSDKLESLRKINPNLLDPEDVTVIAHPSKNPAIWVISHVRRLSEEYEVEIAEMSVEKESGSDNINSSSLTIGVETKDYTKLLSFLNDYTKILPVTSLNNVSIKRSVNQSEEIFGGEITTYFYWSNFPDTLPPITEPINELTNEDQSVIAAISAYKSPAFIELRPNEPQDRQQPFN